MHWHSRSIRSALVLQVTHFPYQSPLKVPWNTPEFLQVSLRKQKKDWWKVLAGRFYKTETPGYTGTQIKEAALKRAFLSLGTVGKSLSFPGIHVQHRDKFLTVLWLSIQPLYTRAVSALYIHELPNRIRSDYITAESFSRHLYKTLLVGHLSILSTSRPQSRALPFQPRQNFFYSCCFL